MRTGPLRSVCWVRLSGRARCTADSRDSSILEISTETATYTCGKHLLCKTMHNTTQYNTIQYNTILYYTILYYTILYYTILYYTILYYTILYYTKLYYTILYYTILYYTMTAFAELPWLSLTHSEPGMLGLPCHTLHLQGWSCGLQPFELRAVYPGHPNSPK